MHTRAVTNSSSFSSMTPPPAVPTRSSNKRDIVFTPELPNTNANANPRRRFNRRASTGGACSNPGSAYGYVKEELSSSIHSGGGGGGGGSSTCRDEEMSQAAEDEPSFMKALRAGSMSREESLKKLETSLAMVHDYKDRGDKIHALRERFTSSKRSLKNKKGRPMARRSSLSSTYSSTNYSSTGGDSTSYADTPTRSRPNSGDDLSLAEFSIEVTETPSKRSGEEISFAMSFETAPVNNVRETENDGLRKAAVKTEQIVESLVWFSFHTPRTVLEDLIAHEMDVWRRENALAIRSTHKARKSNKLLTRSRTDEENDDDVDVDDEGSLSSLSDDGNVTEVYGGKYSESILAKQRITNASNMIALPKFVERESALLFVDMSGFTKLSTMLDVESLSKVINSYFDMIVSEVILHGGDILKFAGDAFFAEWKVVGGNNDSESGARNPLADLNASLASINEMAWDDDDVPKLSTCVLSAAKCGTAIVKKFSDFQVASGSNGVGGAMLNVHCGIGAGHLVGLHVGDYKEDPEEDGVELRREFLILGDPIDQVSKAADVATDGEVMISPEALLSLAFCCSVSYEQRNSTKPVCIASREDAFLHFDPVSGDTSPAALQPYESLRMHCNALSHTALARLHLQMALYVHPVIRGDEMALSAAIQAGKISQPTETLESRHRAEAELRSVYTIFIKAVISPRITHVKEVDEELYKKLGDIMHVTSRELDRYSGHLRQFIVDDKGVVLIATFGLRGSTFPNMVANNGLPATFAIHRALKQEVSVENRIGATFGKVYCGVVGGVRRHEFAVMGAPVNLAARLCNSKVNKGILVDEAVRAQADARFEFTNLPPVEAKGYDKPVPICEPLSAVSNKKKKSTFPFIGRREEMEKIASISSEILNSTATNSCTMVVLMGESGMGKSALALSALQVIKENFLSIEAKKQSLALERSIVTARSTSTETEQRIPLSAYRKIFYSIIRDLCDYDGTALLDEALVADKSIANSFVTNTVAAPQIIAPQSGVSSAHLRRTPGRRWGLSGQNRMGDGISSSERPSVSRTNALKAIPDDNFNASGRVGSRTALYPGSVHRRAGSFRQLAIPEAFRDSDGRSKNDSLTQSLHRVSATATASAKSSKVIQTKRQNSAGKSSKGLNCEDSCSNISYDASLHRNGQIPYFEKLCWICEEINYPYEYADIVGSQFLNLEGADPCTHVDGHIPTMDELVTFLAQVFVRTIDYADLSVFFIDDFQWVDSFSWKIFQAVCQKGASTLFLCAMRSHDKQALRRLSTAANRQLQTQSQMIEISLGPLDTLEIRELMSKVLGYAQSVIPDSICADLFQRTGGLPVYVVQVLENIKRMNTLEIAEDGMLQWNAAGLKEKRAMASNKTGAVMEETFLSRFDVLDVRVRKILQTCAVLGLSFALSDVIQVHPEMEEADIEHALNAAVDEMVLVEQVEDEDDNASLRSASTGLESDTHTNINSAARTSEGIKDQDDRFFQFSHAMWRKNVLTTMLKERKIELHRLIASAMENDQGQVSEESDISRLLTLFDHWKSCGDFLKSAPLALAAGARLEEWDLSAQSLELYEDALEMSFDSVYADDSVGQTNDWIQVSAKPKVLDMILRLHIRVGLCHQRLGDSYQSISTFEDALKIVTTSSKIPGMSKSLLMPIFASLCVLKIEEGGQDKQTKCEIEKLLERFMRDAKENGSAVHIGRALSMRAMYHARTGDLKKAISDFAKLNAAYDFEENSGDMIAEYGRDFALECFAESATWHYLMEDHKAAEQRAEAVISKFLPLIDPLDMDSMMYAILPVLHVLKLLDRVSEADLLLKKYVINPAHDHSMQSEYWTPLFNPLAYLFEVNMMEEDEQYDDDVVEELEKWVLNDANREFDIDLERKGHTLIGELCWRLSNFKEDHDPSREILLTKARELLTPIARYPHGETFLRQTAQALLEAL